MEILKKRVTEELNLVEDIPSSSDNLQVRTSEIQEYDEDDIEFQQNRSVNFATTPLLTRIFLFKI